MLKLLIFHLKHFQPLMPHIGFKSPSCNVAHFRKEDQKEAMLLILGSKTDQRGETLITTLSNPSFLLLPIIGTSAQW
jgi:hypothetical protein